MVGETGGIERNEPLAEGLAHECVTLAKCMVAVRDVCTVMSQGGSEYRNERRFHEMCCGKKARIVRIGTDTVDIEMLEGYGVGQVFTGVRPDILLLEGTFVRKNSAGTLQRFLIDMLP